MRSVGSSSSKDQMSKNKKTQHKQSNVKEKQVEGISHVISQANGDPFISFNISIMQMFVASSNDIMARHVDEHKLMQELGEALEILNQILEPNTFPMIKKNHD